MFVCLSVCLCVCPSVSCPLKIHIMVERRQINPGYKSAWPPTYREKSDLQPVAELTRQRRLRSSSTSALAVPRTRLRTIGDRTFPIAAARTWNSLPPEVTSSRTLSSFKSKLKTYLFKLSFPHSDSVK